MRPCTDGRFAAELARQRVAAGWSQSHLAAEAGLDHSYIGQLERGQREPSRDTVAALAVLVAPDRAAECRLFIAAGYLPPGDWEMLDDWAIRCVPKEAPMTD